MSERRAPLCIAVVGCGWAGARHVRAFAACGAEVRWAVDVDADRAGLLKESLGEAGRVVRTGADYGEALGDDVVDAVVICLPHALHAPLAVESAEAGKHVLCEKPMACSLAEADRMIAAADSAGVILMIAENVRFSPLLHRVRDMLHEGAIGRPALIQVTRQACLARSFLNERRWFLDARAAGGGIMMSGGIHDVETMRMLAGKVESIYAQRARQRFAEMGGDDTSVALIRFRDGTVGTLVESFVAKSLTTMAGREVHTLHIDGDLGSLLVQDGQTIQLFSERDDLLIGGALTQHDIHVPAADTFLLEAEHFIQSIRAGKEPVTSGRSQRRSLEIVLAAYESMRSGQPVTLC
jgi:predicted dehydrogenase